MRKSFLLAVLIVGLQVFSPSGSSATPEYAAQTGRPCVACHIDPAGGGPLTETGGRFLEGLKTGGLTLHHLLRFIAGYVHLMTAIIWFGTILYVHILLKPAYAAKGLPRGELALGWMSMLLITVSGIVLTLDRVQSWQILYTTRFGILLAIKILLFIIMVSSAVVVTLFIGPRLKKRRHAPRTARGDFSPAELALFDGKEGRSAYIAYRGTVYDVTGSRLWKDGIHLKKHSAGNDLTGILSTAPHGEEKVLAMPKVGALKAAAGITARPFHEKLFYFFAYMNLVFTFLIVFVVALLRWW